MGLTEAWGNEKGKNSLRKINMTTEQKKISFEGLPPLPPRERVEDLAWVQKWAERGGYNPELNARTHSASEWSIDLDRAAEMASEHGLDDSQWNGLIEHFRERNKSVWGAYSDTDWTRHDAAFSESDN